MRISNDLEDEAFTQSKGENTREYRTRVNTVKIKMKGDRGKFLRQCLYDGSVTPKDIMAMDMNKLNDDYLR